MTVKVVFEGHACRDCAQVIANDEWSGITDPEAHRAAIESTALWELGHVAIACPEDCEGEYRTDPCDYCGDPLDGDRHPIVVLSEN